MQTRFAGHDTVLEGRHSSLTQLSARRSASNRHPRGTDSPACLDFERHGGKKVADARPVPTARQAPGKRSAGRRLVPPTRAQVAWTTLLGELGTATDLCHKVTACLQSRRDFLHDARRQPERKAQALLACNLAEILCVSDEPEGRCQTSPRAATRLNSNS